MYVPSPYLHHFLLKNKFILSLCTCILLEKLGLAIRIDISSSLKHLVSGKSWFELYIQLYLKVQ